MSEKYHACKCHVEALGVLIRRGKSSPEAAIVNRHGAISSEVQRGPASCCYGYVIIIMRFPSGGSCAAFLAWWRPW